LGGRLHEALRVENPDEIREERDEAVNTVRRHIKKIEHQDAAFIELLEKNSKDLAGC
jgi:hypothetical protein